MDPKTSGEDVKIIVTAGATYLDIDAYACCVALSELLNLKGMHAVAYSEAPYNYSVLQSLLTSGEMLNILPLEYAEKSAKYMIVDVSDPDYLKDSIPLQNVIAVYDHHVGFEAYWQSCIGDHAHIEFIGAAATLIYEEWKSSGLAEHMKATTARLLVAAILDNTLNLTSSNTTPADKEAFDALCKKGNVQKEWCAAYFSEVQKCVEADLQNALLNDVKTTYGFNALPPHMAQICIWDSKRIFTRMAEIRTWFNQMYDSWMINVIDVQHRCSYFVCDETHYQNIIESVFEVHFESGIAKSEVSYLRKEIIKRIMHKS